MQNHKCNYPTEVFWSEEDEGYIALVPDLPGCSAWGATEEQALYEIQAAAQAWLEAAKAMGQEFPVTNNGCCPISQRNIGKEILNGLQEIKAWRQKKIQLKTSKMVKPEQEEI